MLKTQFSQVIQILTFLVKHGVEHIWVSNHGGRQLSDVRSTIEILPEVVGAVQGKAKVYVDCGVRYGSDVFKCLALGKKIIENNF